MDFLLKALFWMVLVVIVGTVGWYFWLLVVKPIFAILRFFGVLKGAQHPEVSQVQAELTPQDLLAEDRRASEGWRRDRDI